ncbi:MAG: type II toxin-antitoxin system RelE/ParE family toxin [Lactobacillales bacterium]|nr:type II toxin-antitoxin system RelE/ParE family toxin [Lactobacillales bacterium]
MYDVEIKETAWKDIESIYAYIVTTFKSIDKAENHYEAFLQAINELTYDAGIRPIFVERKGINLYRKSVKNYALIYSLIGTQVKVLRIFHESQDMLYKLHFRKS